MSRFFAPLVIFLGLILSSGATHMCLSSDLCVPRENCREEEPFFGFRSTIECSDAEVCCEKSNVIGMISPPQHPLDRLLGTSNPNGLAGSTQVHDDQSKPNQFPWVMALFVKDFYLGGGSLITAGLVLTAAHILVELSPNDIMVRAGEWDLSSSEKLSPPTERQVIKILNHEAFNYSSAANNLALLFLDSPFQLGANIQTIRLPIPDKTFDQRICTVAGWGMRSSADVDVQPIQQKVDLPVVESPKCQGQLRLTRLGSNYQLPASLMCAGGEEGRDVCFLFGGSALFCSLDGDPNRYEQAGIVSFGVGCGQPNVPTTFTHVSKFREWINPHLKQVLSVPGNTLPAMSYYP
ncbi:phenoloxidase-activating factor 2 [Drosophila mauritiana]|uniref:Phenoloxidase-activating factor 2 n=1 Tax=Drosophila mauritiana TaxID=7226 RepID=A0A6P8J8T0_DROMA|nr:phenoloxidase-activating factor 2 [Drosophila mauritiana]